jgi:hypothetical protein
MKEIIGNGQPGRIGKLEEKHVALEKDQASSVRILYMLMGGLGLLQFLAANGWLRIH